MNHYPFSYHSFTNLCIFANILLIAEAFVGTLMVLFIFRLIAVISLKWPIQRISSKKVHYLPSFVPEKNNQNRSESIYWGTGVKKVAPFVFVVLVLIWMRANITGGLLSSVGSGLAVISLTQCKHQQQLIRLGPYVGLVEESYTVL